MQETTGIIYPARLSYCNPPENELECTGRVPGHHDADADARLTARLRERRHAGDHRLGVRGGGEALPFPVVFRCQAANPLFRDHDAALLGRRKEQQPLLNIRRQMDEVQNQCLATAEERASFETCVSL